MCLYKYLGKIGIFGDIQVCQNDSPACYSVTLINDSGCSFFSTMQGITVLVLVLVLYIQTVHAQQGQ